MNALPVWVVVLMLIAVLLACAWLLVFFAQHPVVYGILG